MRILEEKCEKCGQNKIMYYRAYCPKCYIPKPETTIHYNLFELIYYVEARRRGAKDRIWDFFVDIEFIRGNDSFEYLAFSDFSDEYYTEKYPDVVDDLLFMQKELNLPDDVKVEVSW